MDKGPFIEGRLVAPFSRPGKIICIGLNYRDHAKETGAEIPTEPVVFSKFSNTITSPEAPVVLPSVAHQVDFEAELVAVIGKTAKNVSKSKAIEFIAGYTCGNDVSARDWQKGRPGGQWLMGKTPDTFAPIGPWFVTADEIGDPHDLAISLKLNQVVMQQSRTNELIFGIDELVAHLSQLVTLEPGDLIFTGDAIRRGRRPQTTSLPEKWRCHGSRDRRDRRPAKSGGRRIAQSIATLRLATFRRRRQQL